MQRILSILLSLLIADLDMKNRIESASPGFDPERRSSGSERKRRKKSAAASDTELAAT